MELTELGKQLLKLGTHRSSLEHVDSSLECTKDIPNQYVRDTGGNAGDDFEFDISEKDRQQIDNLLSDVFTLKLPGEK